MNKFEANAVTWFEIPTTDFERATRFYEDLLASKLVPFPGPEPCKMFPKPSSEGSGGCIIQRADHHPCDNGTVVFLNVDGQLNAALERAAAMKAKIIEPRTELPNNLGAYACIRDSEGNRVGLHTRGA